MAKAVTPQKDANFFLIEGRIGDVMLRFMQSSLDGKTFWLIGETGETPEHFTDLDAAHAQWHFLIDLYVMKLMVVAEKKACQEEK